MIDYTITLGRGEQDVMAEIAMQDSAFRSVQKKTKIGITAVGCCFLLFGILLKNVILIIGGLVFAAFGIWGVGPVQKAQVKKRYRQADQRVVGGTRHYLVSDEGIEITSQFGSGLSNWTAFIAAGECGHYIWLRRADRSLVLFDRNQLTEDQLQELEGYLKDIRI